MSAARTRLYPWHQAAGARFVPFGGWDMPVYYPTGAIAEHHATRESATLFDIDHMGQVWVTGADAGAYLDYLVSSAPSDVPVGLSRYGLLCNADGGVLDDVFVYHIAQDEWMVVVNASNRETDVAWMQQHAAGYAVTVEDRSPRVYMIALQGPRAMDVAAATFEAPGLSALHQLPRFGLTGLRFGELAVLASRTGYTGEDGLELFFEDQHAPQLWQALIDGGCAIGVEVSPAGLAARDSLRLEAGFALYGHELSAELTPVEAALLWACNLKSNFIGRDAIVARKQTGPARRLIRFRVMDEGVVRAETPIVTADGTTVGVAVSGGRAPSVGAFVGNAFVDSAVLSAGTALFAAVRGRKLAIERNAGPFYKPYYPALPPAAQLMDRGAEYAGRHNGPRGPEVEAMLHTLGAQTIEQLIEQTVPADIRLPRPLDLPAPVSEDQLLANLRALAGRNQPFRSLIGMGYADAIMPPVIQRTILENPGWYTQYTPYQAEIAQGRLEALLNFQTMVVELTGMEVTNASLLDEATAAGEAMTMALRARARGSSALTFLVADSVHPNTIAHLVSRAAPLNVRVVVAPVRDWQIDAAVFGGLLQYPTTDGLIEDYRSVVETLHGVGALVVVAADILALTLLVPPGEWGADVVVGNTQRFGLPLMFGGPHAAFFATRESLKRLMPGRLVGVSKDSSGKPALRLSLQTREQHIRRDKATSNICTAQVLLAILASMYAVYHGRHGLQTIARRVHLLAERLRSGLKDAGWNVTEGPIFDTLTVKTGAHRRAMIHDRVLAAGFNLRYYADNRIGVTLDERSTVDEVERLLTVFGRGDTNAGPRSAGTDASPAPASSALAATPLRFPVQFERRSDFLIPSVFTNYRTETTLLRYITQLQSKDLSLAHSMIPLGSCTMKLNPAAAMLGITWPEFAALHPYAPEWQAQGTLQMLSQLQQWLIEITGFDGCTLQPNSGAQGEYAGLLIIRSYHLSRGDTQRTVCIVPESAHGTNPASAVMAGMDVVVVGSRPNGDIDLDDLAAKIAAAGDRLSACMITYPSTHGVFETTIRTAIKMIHDAGGQVYMDGANMNAQVGLTSPGFIGADVCHLNLHKTFAIPHGGGGPGVGPVLTAKHLTPFLPGRLGAEGPTGLVAGAPFGSAGVAAISYAYIAMMGEPGLRNATQLAILNANYIATRLAPYYPVLFTGANGRVAHECILDLRHIERETGVTGEDVAKRLADYGFHAPTMSWPVHGTLMVEPTESENKAELDRFCDAMIAIAGEIEAVRRGDYPVDQSPLRRAPHTVETLVEEWDRPYTRSTAVFPLPFVKERKFWPAVGRVDNVWGDRNLVCTCAPLEAYKQEHA